MSISDIGLYIFIALFVIMFIVDVYVAVDAIRVFRKK